MVVHNGDTCLLWRAWRCFSSSPILCYWMFRLSMPSLCSIIPRQRWMQAVIRRFIHRMAIRFRFVLAPSQRVAIVSGGRGSSGICWAITYPSTGAMPPTGLLMPSEVAYRWEQLPALVLSPSFLVPTESGPLGQPDTSLLSPMSVLIAVHLMLPIRTMATRSQCILALAIMFLLSMNRNTRTARCVSSTSPGRLIATYFPISPASMAMALPNCHWQTA